MQQHHLVSFHFVAMNALHVENTTTDLTNEDENDALDSQPSLLDSLKAVTYTGIHRCKNKTLVSLPTLIFWCDSCQTDVNYLHLLRQIDSKDIITLNELLCRQPSLQCHACKNYLNEMLLQQKPIWVLKTLWNSLTYCVQFKGRLRRAYMKFSSCIHPSDPICEFEDDSPDENTDITITGVACKTCANHIPTAKWVRVDIIKRGSFCMYEEEDNEEKGSFKYSCFKKGAYTHGKIHYCSPNDECNEDNYDSNLNGYCKVVGTKGWPRRISSNTGSGTIYTYCRTHFDLMKLRWRSAGLDEKHENKFSHIHWNGFGNMPQKAKKKRKNKECSHEECTKSSSFGFLPHDGGVAKYETCYTHKEKDMINLKRWKQ